jgi:cyclic beta-1,2-glucan synthetase
MYRSGVEGILGIRREGAFLVMDPYIPAAWPGFEATVKVASTHYDIRVENPSGAGRNVLQAVLDGAPVARTEGCVRVPLDGEKHALVIRLGGEKS